MAVIKAVSSKAGIGQALDYVTKEEKTEDKLVSGLHCEPDTVKDEMQATKELWEKTGGRTYTVSYTHLDVYKRQGHTSTLSRATIRTRKSRRSRHTGTPYSLQRIRRHGKGLRCLWLPIRTKNISIRTLSSIPSILRTGTSCSGAAPTCRS